MDLEFDDSQDNLFTYDKRSDKDAAFCSFRSYWHNFKGDMWNPLANMLLIFPTSSLLRVCVCVDSYKDKKAPRDYFEFIEIVFIKQNVLKETTVLWTILWTFFIYTFTSLILEIVMFRYNLSPIIVTVVFFFFSFWEQWVVHLVGFSQILGCLSGKVVHVKLYNTSLNFACSLESVWRYRAGTEMF